MSKQLCSYFAGETLDIHVIIWHPKDSKTNLVIVFHLIRNFPVKLCICNFKSDSRTYAGPVCFRTIFISPSLKSYGTVCIMVPAQT